MIKVHKTMEIHFRHVLYLTEITFHKYEALDERYWKPIDNVLNHVTNNTLCELTCLYVAVKTPSVHLIDYMWLS